MEKLEQTFKTVRFGEIYRSVINDTERKLIQKALEHTAGNQIKAARALGLNRNTLRAKIVKLNIQPSQFRHE